MEKTGRILGYRRGPNDQYTSQVLVKIDGVDSYKDASRLIGAKIVLKDRHGNTYIGKIVGVHGRKGVVRAVFRRNIPGQAIGSIIHVITS